ncbi:MAG TPA: group 1 truncated hemoglobin [Mycobacteriales bacterium]|nr:group 1 truncated hemoglobin [Mycobacteriales bacterium]
MTTHSGATGYPLGPGRDDDTLYRRLGGAWAVDVAVELFYRRVLWDERIAHFFTDVDMDRQIAKQVGFLTMAFGGPSNYSGRDLAQAHQHLLDRGMTDEHLDVVLELLADTLRLMGASEDDVAEVTKTTEAVRDDVMGRRHW